MSGPRGPLLIISVVLAAFVFGYKQDSLVSSVRDRWTQWRAGAPAEPAAPGPANAGTAGTPAPGPAPAGPYPSAPLNTAGGTPVRQQPSLAQSLDSVTAGQVEPKQEERRNLYFEKLSEQLRELRGENPPPGGAPTGAPPPPAPPLPEETVAEEQDVPEEEGMEPDDGADIEDEDSLPEEPDEEAPEE